MVWKKEVEQNNAVCEEYYKEINEVKPLNIPTTDYTKQLVKDYRKKMIGRYTYLFSKPYQELQDFEKGLYWYLRIEGYDHLTSIFNDENFMAWEQVRRLENKTDTILQSMKIPYSLVENYALIEKNTDRTIRLKPVIGGSIYD